MPAQADSSVVVAVAVAVVARAFREPDAAVLCFDVECLVTAGVPAGKASAAFAVDLAKRKVVLDAAVDGAALQGCGGGFGQGQLDAAVLRQDVARYAAVP